MNAMTARLETLATAQLTDICRSLMNDFRDGADAVFDAAFRIAQKRMTSAEFIVLCNELEAATDAHASSVPYPRLDGTPRMRIA